MGHALRNYIIRQVALYGAAVSFILILGASLNILPRPIVELFQFGAANFALLVFAFLFCVGAYVALKFIGRSHGK